MRRAMGYLVLWAACAPSAACHIVAPYERARLAHPSMTNDVQGTAAVHVYGVHEGATGGSLPVAASGCGCN
jgi:hypothetical protein